MINTIFKTEEEIRWFLKGVPLKFDFRGDSIISYKSVIPLTLFDPEEEQEEFKIVLANVTVDFFDEQENDLFCYDTIDNFLELYKIFEVKIQYLGEKNETIYRCKFDSEGNELYK